MREARRTRVGVALVVAVLSTTGFAACRSRPRHNPAITEAPADQPRPAPEARTDPRVRGLVFDELGPPPPATVHVLRWQGDPAEEGPVRDALEAVPTDASGAFSFELTSAASNELRIDVAGLAPRSLYVPVDPSDPPILLLGTRTLHGVVRDPEGRAVAGALVRVGVWPQKRVHGQDATFHVIRARTAADGSYRFDRLPGGKCRIWLDEKTPEGESWSEEEHRTFGVHERIVRVDLGSAARQPQVTVRVLSAPGGDPRRVPGVLFRSASGRRRWASFIGDGTYTGRLPPGTYEALMPVQVEVDGTHREGEAALHDASGRPAILIVRQDAPDPIVELYLPPR